MALSLTACELKAVEAEAAKVDEKEAAAMELLSKKNSVCLRNFFAILPAHNVSYRPQGSLDSLGSADIYLQILLLKGNPSLTKF